MKNIAGFTLFSRNERAFTLIELMIVISILAILATTGVSVFNGLQKNSRDQGRLRDLNLIKQALEMYRSDSGSYPATFNLDCASSTLSSPDGSKVYLSELIRDPKCNAQTYVYQAYSRSGGGCTGPNCAGFVLCAGKEGNGDLSPPNACLVLDCGTGPNSCNMGVSSD